MYIYLYLYLQLHQTVARRCSHVNSKHQPLKSDSKHAPTDAAHNLCLQLNNY